MTAALTRLSRSMEQMEARYQASQRANRRIRILLAVVLLALGVTAYQTFSPMMKLLELIPKTSRAAQDDAAAAATRQRLLALLPEKQQAQIKSFEEQQEWLAAYMRASPNFNTGPTIALFLAQMADSMLVMPDMYAEIQAMSAEMQSMNEAMRSIDGQIVSMNQEMRSMSTNINALPALTAEIQGMHGKMGVMAAGMDSTMGRAGRMFPWP